MTYKCNVCGVEYRDFDTAEKCEKTHKIPIKVDKAKYAKRQTQRKNIRNLYLSISQMIRVHDITERDGKS